MTKVQKGDRRKPTCRHITNQRHAAAVTTAINSKQTRNSKLNDYSTTTVVFYGDQRLC